jgi:hypothetical protein
VAILLLLLLVGFLIGLSVYQGRGAALSGAMPAQAPASGGVTPRTSSHPGSQESDAAGPPLTLLKHIGTALPSGAGSPPDDGRLHNLVYLRDWTPGNDPIGDGGVPGTGASGAGANGPGFGGSGPGFTGGAGGGDAPDDERTPIDFTRDSKSPPKTDSLAPPDISTAISAVPEPQSWILMILGFGGAGLMMRRRASTPKLLSP